MSAASRETVSGALTPGNSTAHHVAMMRLTAYARDVPGDVIVVDAGADVPADARVVTAAALVVVESVLHWTLLRGICYETH